MQGQTGRTSPRSQRGTTLSLRRPAAERPFESFERPNARLGPCSRGFEGSDLAHEVHSLRNEGRFGSPVRQEEVREPPRLRSERRTRASIAHSRRRRPRRLRRERRSDEDLARTEGFDARSRGDVLRDRVSVAHSKRRERSVPSRIRCSYATSARSDANVARGSALKQTARGSVSDKPRSERDKVTNEPRSFRCVPHERGSFARLVGLFAPSLGNETEGVSLHARSYRFFLRAQRYERHNARFVVDKDRFERDRARLVFETRVSGPRADASVATRSRFVIGSRGFFPRSCRRFARSFGYEPRSCPCRARCRVGRGRSERSGP